MSEEMAGASAAAEAESVSETGTAPEAGLVSGTSGAEGGVKSAAGGVFGDVPGLTDAGGEGGEAESGKKGEDGNESGDVKDRYEFRVPEGFVLDEQMKDAAVPLLAKYKVSGEDAQTLADLVTQKVQREMDALHDRNLETVAGWQKRLAADAEVGGNNLRRNLGVGLKALNRFGDAELSNILKESGLEYHPAVVRFFYRVGTALSEDSYVGQNAPRRAADTASLLYGGGNK